MHKHTTACRQACTVCDPLLAPRLTLLRCTSTGLFAGITSPASRLTISALLNAASCFHCFQCNVQQNHGVTVKWKEALIDIFISETIKWQYDRAGTWIYISVQTAAWQQHVELVETKPVMVVANRLTNRSAFSFCYKLLYFFPIRWLNNWKRKSIFKIIAARKEREEREMK